MHADWTDLCFCWKSAVKWSSAFSPSLPQCTWWCVSRVGLSDTSNPSACKLSKGEKCWIKAPPSLHQLQHTLPSETNNCREQSGWKNEKIHILLCLPGAFRGTHGSKLMSKLSKDVFVFVSEQSMLPVRFQQDKPWAERRKSSKHISHYSLLFIALTLQAGAAASSLLCLTILWIIWISWEVFNICFNGKSTEAPSTWGDSSEAGGGFLKLILKKQVRLVQ